MWPFIYAFSVVMDIMEVKLDHQLASIKQQQQSASAAKPQEAKA